MRAQGRHYCFFPFFPEVRPTRRKRGRRQLSDATGRRVQPLGLAKFPVITKKPKKRSWRQNCSRWANILNIDFEDRKHWDNHLLWLLSPSMNFIVYLLRTLLLPYICNPRNVHYCCMKINYAIQFLDHSPHNKQMVVAFPGAHFQRPRWRIC